MSYLPDVYGAAMHQRASDNRRIRRRNLPNLDLHRGIQTQRLVDNRPQILHVADVVISRTASGPDNAEDLLTEALQDVRVLGKPVDSEGQCARRGVTTRKQDVERLVVDNVVV